MATTTAGRIGQVSHEDRLPLVGHLTELRARLILSLVVVAAAFAVCMWQNNALLDFINAPLAQETQKRVTEGDGPLGANYRVQEGARAVGTQLQAIVSALDAPGSGVAPETRKALAATAPKLDRAINSLSAPPQGNKPVTLGVGEPFMTTLSIALLFAFVISLPFLLFQAYAFLIPAIRPEQGDAVRPLLFAVPVLFVIGAAFGYLVVLPAAVRFFQNFNGDQFNVLVQASQYYRFAGTILLAMGLVFQVPIGVLAVTRAGIVSTDQLAANRRYALLGSGGAAAFLPGDLVTMLLITAPLYLLFETSLLLARTLERRGARRALSG